MNVAGHRKEDLVVQVTTRIAERTATGEEARIAVITRKQIMREIGPQAGTRECPMMMTADIPCTVIKVTIRV